MGDTLVGEESLEAERLLTNQIIYRLAAREGVLLYPAGVADKSAPPEDRIVAVHPDFVLN